VDLKAPVETPRASINGRNVRQRRQSGSVGAAGRRDRTLRDELASRSQEFLDLASHIGRNLSLHAKIDVSVANHFHAYGDKSIRLHAWLPYSQPKLAH
jgi:hypothetical protein